MVEELFINGNSIIHRFDPRARIIVSFIFSVVVALCDQIEALLTALVFSLIVLVISKLPLKKVCQRMAIANGLILAIWIFLPFSMKGDPLFTIGPLEWTKQGAAYSLMITLKSNAIILILITQLATMSVFTMGRAMGYLRLPRKIVQIFVFTWRYIHVIFSEYRQMLTTIKTRGFVPKSNAHTYKTYAYLVGMLLIRSYERAERVRAAMLCRGFKGRFYDLSSFSFKKSDGAIAILMLLAVCTIGVIQLTSI